MNELEKRTGAAPAPRIGDPERAVAARRLQQAVDEGRLDLLELDQRLVALYSARTKAELAAVTADLPIAAAEPIELRVESGSQAKRGHWTVPETITAHCASGRIVLDFTAAECAHQEVTVRAEVDSGSVLLVVPYGWQVNLDRVRVQSGTAADKVHGPHLPGAPAIRVEGTARSGSIKARYPRRSFWGWLLRRRP